MNNTINEMWTNVDRIGYIQPTYKKEYFLNIENHIIKTCAQYELTCKFNVSPLIGGVPPRDDITQVVNGLVNAIAYHDCMGGILVSTRNAEVNCRNFDHIFSNTHVDDSIISQMLEQIQDKYILEKQETTYDKVIFLPGSNLFHTVNWEKVEEALIDYPDVMIKLHPVMTDAAADKIKDKYRERIISQNVSGLHLLMNAKLIWTSYNSEFGMIAAMCKIPFGVISKWNDVFTMVYSPVYRHFKYKDVDHNYLVISKALASNRSGFVFPWQNDWKMKVETYFESVVNKFSTGLEYPYA